jgi:hypothetical protein
MGNKNMVRLYIDWNSGLDIIYAIAGQQLQLLAASAACGPPRKHHGST